MVSAIYSCPAGGSPGILTIAVSPENTPATPSVIEFKLPVGGSPPPLCGRLEHLRSDSEIVANVTAGPRERLEKNIPRLPYEVLRIVRTQSCPDLSILLTQS